MVLVCSRFGILHARKNEVFLHIIISNWRFGSLSDVTDAVELQDEMSILVGSLLGLPFFDSSLQEVDSLFVFFLKLSLDALVLDVLQSVHLRRISHGILRCQRLRLIVDIPSGVQYALGRFLSVLYELEVVLVENNFLDILRRHLPHKEALLIPFFVTLHDFVFEAQELQDLIEHVRGN
jgi:hypothetical protein